MSTFGDLWKKLGGSKAYREEFVAAQVKQGIPFQIRCLMKQHGFTQERLAENAGLNQGVVSRAANPHYGNLTLNTIIRIAAGFDVAFVGRFVPFSDLGRWFAGLSEESCRVPTFNQEDEQFQSSDKSAQEWDHGQAELFIVARAVPQIDQAFHASDDLAKTPRLGPTTASWQYRPEDGALDGTIESTASKGRVAV